MAEKSNQAAIGDGSLHVGDRVVYPNQGICRITGVAAKTIAGMEIEMVTLSREEDSATVMVPKAKVMGIGLRKVADVAAIDKVFDELASPSDSPQLDWKVRHRENAERMSGGGLFGTVDVLRSLHTLARVRPLPPKERELYDNARHLLVGEIAAAMDIPLHVAEDNLDYALWPPAGMKRKGKELPPATLGPPTPIRAAGDDDLGFEDDDADEDAEKPAANAPAAGADDGEDKDDEKEEGEAPPPPPPAKKPGRVKAAKPAAVSAVAPLTDSAAATKAAPAPLHAAPKPFSPLPASPTAAAPKAFSALPPGPAAAAPKPPAHVALPAPRPAAESRPVAKKAVAAAPPAAAKKKPTPAAAPARKAAPAKKAAAAVAAKKPAPKSKPKGKK